jgi:hypothetical protein
MLARAVRGVSRRVFSTCESLRSMITSQLGECGAVGRGGRLFWFRREVQPSARLPPPRQLPHPRFARFWSFHVASLPTMRACLALWQGCDGWIVAQPLDPRCPLPPSPVTSPRASTASSAI